MFGIGLPEMLLIFALALIVVGPDKLPELARSVAKGIFELKKTAESLKDSIDKEGDPLGETKKELEDVASSLRKNLLDTPNFNASLNSELKDTTGAGDAKSAYEELMKNQINTQVDTNEFIDIESDDKPAAPEKVESEKKSGK